MQHKGRSPKLYQTTVGGTTKPGNLEKLQQNWANKIAGFWDERKKEGQANYQAGRIATHSRRCDNARWKNLIAKGKFLMDGLIRETGTEMNEPTMEKLISAAWKETEKEHRNYVAERIKRRDRKLNEAYSKNGEYLHQWIRQSYQTPIATMRRADGCITMNFQEIHQILTEAWRPIFARWNGKKEEPRYAEFEERFGRFIPRKPMDAQMLTGAELRNTVRRWSDKAAAGADSWKRCEWKQFTNTMFDQVAEYLNIIEESACEMSYEKLIETIMARRHTNNLGRKHQEKVESPGPKDVRPITLAATLYCAWSSTRYREAMVCAKQEWLHKTVHGGVPGARVQNAIWPLLMKMEAMTKMREKKESRQRRLTQRSTSTAYVGR